MKVALAVAAGLLLLTACSGQGVSTPSPSAPPSGSPVAPSVGVALPSPAATASVAPSALPVCPNPEGGASNACLGPIAAGTYTTKFFQPQLTYTVPAGWGNLEDLSGNFLLLPPGATLEGVNPETSDFLGVYRSVVAPEVCTGEASGTVPLTYDGLLAYLTSHPQLTVTNPKQITVGGLRGVTIDVQMKPGAGDGCAQGIWVDVYVGKSPTSLVHAVSPDYGLRLDLLRNGDDTVAIEVADARGGSDYPDWWAAADEVIKSFSFSTP
jgi:hypothetical protein